MAAAVDRRPQGPLTHKEIVTILIGLMMGMFLAALDQTIVATAVRTIADDLKGLNEQAWATTAYLITSTIVTPLYGKLSDIYGRKPFFITAISIFIFGSILCTFADSMFQLAAYRAVQGLGAGGLFSLALAIIGDIVPPRERAKYQGYFLAVFGTSSVLGPVIGGFFAGTETIMGIDGWRWVFLVNVPIGLAALLVVSKTLHLHHTRLDHRIDWWGAATLSATLVPLLLVLEQGREWGWTSAASLTCFAIGVVSAVAFFIIEKAMGEEAILPLALFRDPDRGCGLHRVGHHRCRDVRRPGLPAAVPADRQGRDADRGRLAPAADDPGHHGGLDRLRCRHRQDRPLPPLPHHRGGTADPVALRLPLRGGRDAAVADHDRDGLLRHRAGLQLPATDPGRAERRQATADRCRDLDGDLHPPDRRHDRHGRLPVHPVLDRARQDHRGDAADRADTRVPGGAEGPGQRRVRPAVRAGPAVGRGCLGEWGAQGQLVPHRPRPASGQALPRGILGLDGPGLPRRCLRHGVRLPRDAPAAARGAALRLGLQRARAG